MMIAAQQSERVYLGVASNIDPEANIPAALDLLRRQVPLLRISTFYRTPPLFRPEQPDYLNGVVLTETEISPRPFKFDILRRIESALARVRTEDSHAARTIDLDILIYGAFQKEESGLSIPDPEIRSRAFLCAALIELSPDIVLPGSITRLCEEADPEAMDALTADEIFTGKLRERFLQ
jgi:2-amino-4-hydroxy-6-hydroxymethyldihydropteridine diphosphokinase